LFDQPIPARAHNRSHSQQSLSSHPGSHSPASNSQSPVPASLANNLGLPLNLQARSGSSAHSPSQTQLAQPQIHTQKPHQFLQQQQGHHLVPQNQRVAQIIQATGHKTTSTAFTNRLNNNSSSQQQQNQHHHFYASSAPSSTVALNHLQHQLRQHRQQRPPVPLFSQSTGNVSQVPPNMSANFEDFNLDDLAGFEGGSATSYSSPAVPVFDVNTPGAGNINNMGTVSPKDLLITASAPNSTALTNLTSPSLYNGSPEFEHFETSPAFDTNGDLGSTDQSDWFPLFPPTDMTAPPAPASSEVKHQEPEHDQSPAQESDVLEAASPAPSNSRRKSGNSPPSGHGRHSSISGVNSRRRDKPLPPIIVDDPTDVVAMKRARNTLAARKSRQRKAEKLEELEGEIEKLKAERDHWKSIAMGRMQ